jgi:hypothetical protein
MCVMTDLECEASASETLAPELERAVDRPDAAERSWPHDYGREAAEAAQVCFMSETGPAPLAPWGIPYNRSVASETDISAGLEYHSLSADFETRLAGALAVLTENKMFPGGASPLALAFPEAQNWRFTKEQILDFPEVAGGVTKLRRSRSQKEWRATRPASREAYQKARVADGSRAKERGEYKAANPDKISAQKSRAAFRRYEKPFVAIDFEGQDYVGDDVDYLGGTHTNHRLFLGMAGGWTRTNDPVALAAIEQEGKTNPAAKARHVALMREGEMLDLDRQR